MSVEITQLTGWDRVAEAAGDTVRKQPREHLTVAWMHRLLLAEHSPIRALTYRVKLTNIPYWVSVHLVRHKIGVEHFVSTQRSDRTGVSRDELPQSALVNHTMILNAQALITISRKRLCMQASQETRATWLAMKSAMDPVMARAMVPDCVYRGHCPELKPCGYTNTECFRQTLAAYRTGPKES